MVLGVGMLSLYPDRGLMGIFTSSRIGGLLARRSLPGAIGILFMLGWVIVWGNRAGYYEGAFQC